VGLSIRKELLRRRGVIASGRVRPPALTLPTALIPILEKHFATLPTTTVTR
jgi:4-hydroxy-tetrahydrodipicolinate synthase